MSARRYIVLLSALVGCASADHGGGTMLDPDGGMQPGPDAGCGELCDSDSDGVLDPTDMCMNTPAGAEVNDVGCADSQLTAEIVPFPPFNLTWTPTGDLGRPGGLVWDYVGIERADLFHIFWVVCDDPATPCGVSLDGPIDTGEYWAFSVADSDLANGKLVYTAATHILLADTSTPTLDARLTLTIADGTTPIAGSTIGTMHLTARAGTHGAEIRGTRFTVKAIVEVKPTAGSTWTPYLDYYDTAATPTAGGGSSISFGGSFYAK
jgi:hypothetical protein